MVETSDLIFEDFSVKLRVYTSFAVNSTSTSTKLLEKVKYR